MRHLNKLVWAALIAGATASPVFAQGGGAPAGGGGGAPAGGGGGAPAGGGGAMGGGGGAGGSGTSLQGTALTTLGSTPQILPPSTNGNTGNTAVSTSNFLGQYYGNPYYQGVLTNSQSSNNLPGGFGAQLFGTSGGGSSGGGQIGFAGTTGGGASRGGASGARWGSSSTNSPSSGIVIPLPTQISYAAIPEFKIDPLTASQVQGEVIRMLRASKEVSLPQTVQVSTEGNTVTIRGNTKDRKEARSIEAMIRMTPGVRSVKNELSYPNE